MLLTRLARRGWLIAVVVTACASAIACGGSRAGALDGPLRPASGSGVGGPTLSHEELSAFLYHFDSLQRDRGALQRRHRELTQTIIQDAPIFPWAAERAIINEFAESAPFAKRSELQVRAAAATEVLGAIDALSDGYKQLQERALDYPGEARVIRQVGLMYAAALAVERRAVQSWGDVVIYGDTDGIVVLSLLGNAASLFAAADQRIADMLVDADAEDLIALHAAWLFEEPTLDF